MALVEHVSKKVSINGGSTRVVTKWQLNLPSGAVFVETIYNGKIGDAVKPRDAILAQKADITLALQELNSLFGGDIALMMQTHNRISRLIEGGFEG